MPFVQRVVQPTYVSRAHGNAFCDRQSRTAVRTTAVSRQKSSQTTCIRKTRAHVHSPISRINPSRPSVNTDDTIDGASLSPSPLPRPTPPPPPPPLPLQPAHAIVIKRNEGDPLAATVVGVKHKTESTNCCCCCCSKQHCCKGSIANNNNNNNNHNNSNNKTGNTNKGIIGSCCNAKTNSLSSFSYSTADIDIDIVDEDVVASHSGKQAICRTAPIDAPHSNQGQQEATTGPKEFLANRSGYSNGDNHCHSSCNGGRNAFLQAVTTEIDKVDDDGIDDTDDIDDVDDVDDVDERHDVVEHINNSGDDIATADADGNNNDSDWRNGDADANATTTETSTVVTGYELESISNITLSNALRQLASLVIIASDIFHDLDKELQNVGDRARSIKAKIDSLDRKVSEFDPKLVTVPESDLGTFAQRKTHYQSDKSFHNELFTSETRPNSVKVLYEEAGKLSQCQLLEFRNDTIDDSTGAVDELVCTPIFGKANRKMRTRIDAEIEIRLPAGIEDLRKWTSTEALGDVTVTPDCMNRVVASISTSIVIGDNGVLTPALSPSVLSADAVDALYSINTSNDNLQIPNEINKDVPLNHRLPSPEEQCKLLALKYPAEIISVDTSGKRFERMCLARKSTTGCALGISEVNNLNDDVQTVSRRSRSRKVRGKRRNTIAGIDQKEIQDAANGGDNDDSGKNNLTVTGCDTTNFDDYCNEEKNKFGRSKSSDVLKKESVALPYDKGKGTLTRLNSLKQWGRNRFKFITPGSNKSGHKSPPKSGVQFNDGANGGGGRDIDDECVVHELTKQKNDVYEKEGRFSRDRKPSYSSSEKSVSLNSNGCRTQSVQKTAAIVSGNVKLRDTSSLNRQRRNGITGQTKDEPHSSSGNWSASSESGRTSIGSEITIQPKSSASNTSLNVSSFHPGSGPPSSIISRRRFLNTSASSSVTSEGTTTPDLQVHETYNDDETSSAYSCDTEGYYTSFHMDSGLRTLKEEEPLSPLQTSFTHTSNYSFGSVSNQTVLTAENEYELFGRGSTSTTTSSAGTVCTTLQINDQGPDVPERISSLSKLSKSNNSASSSTLERSYSSSTVGSTLERTGTIKRNVLAIPKDTVVYDEKTACTNDSSPASQDGEFIFESRLNERNMHPFPAQSIANSEIEQSESSDLEGIERIERIKQKTAITAKRIPSMCIITPSTSDDENIKESSVIPTTSVIPPRSASTVTLPDAKKDYNLNHLKRTLQHPLHNMLDKLKVVLPNKRRSPAKCDVDEDIYDTAGEYVTIADISNNNKHTNNTAAVKSIGLGVYYSNDIVGRKLDSTLSGSSKHETEYVSLNELPCNIRRNHLANVKHPFAIAATEGEDVEKINSHCAVSGVVEMGKSAEASSGKDASQTAISTVSTSSPPTPSASTSTPLSISEEASAGATVQAMVMNETTTTLNRGARVKMNSQGKIIYDSDSLKRRKGAHTTFAPGPYVKETESALLLQVTNSSESRHNNNNSNSQTKSVLSLINGGCANRKIPNVRPVVSHRPPVIVNMTTKCLERPPQPLPQAPAMPMMAPLMPSPSSSSSSSTLTSKSSTSSSASSPSSSTASTATVLDEGYHHFSKFGRTSISPRDKLLTANNPTEQTDETAFDRHASVYWTLQSRRQSKPTAVESCKDDLYATPISKANRNALAKSSTELQRSTNISPIAPRTRSNFFTSTPTKCSYRNSDGNLSADHTITTQTSGQRPVQKVDGNSPERLNTCSDRIGTSKTSLMDFKKLLLAKSAKTIPVQKMSAVELLKMNKRDTDKTVVKNSPDTKPKTNGAQSLNSPMTLLDLSGSPKTFANRRMLRQGQFGSPSKSFAPKQRAGQWRMNTMRTDVMSTTIPEANSEEDHSNSSGGSNHSGSKPSSEIGDSVPDRAQYISEEKFDLKKNFFLQSEENNFMRGNEPRNSFGTTAGGKNIKNFQLNVKRLVNCPPSDQTTANTVTQNYGTNELILTSNNAAFATPLNTITTMNKEANIFPALETAL